MYLYHSVLYLLGVLTVLGHCIENNIVPPNGTLIADFEGGVNTTTFQCDIFNEVTGDQRTTLWHIRDSSSSDRLRQILEDDPDSAAFLISGDERNDSSILPTYRNRITIVNFTAELDGTALFCGTGGGFDLGIFPLRLYRAPMLQDNVMYRVIESSMNVPVNLEQNLATPAFPTPQTFQWTKDGQNVNTNSRITYTYLTVTFNQVMRSDSGEYSLTASNTVLDDSGIEIGSDTGSFTLDVLFGPELTPDSTNYAVLMGQTISLVCGTNLMANPSATVEWRDPNGDVVTDGGRYTIDDGPDSVRLDISNAMSVDTGVWTCIMRVVADNVAVVVDGSLVSRDNVEVGNRTVQITLTVVVAPSEPRLPRLAQIGTTWAQVFWQDPNELGEPDLSRYEVIAINDVTRVQDAVMSTTESNLVNITRLLPGTGYEFRVVAISEVSGVVGRSAQSVGTFGTTHVTVPALYCISAVSLSGDITVTWNYTHTGGLDLTGVMVGYSFTQGQTTPTESVDVGVRDLSYVHSGLVTGFIYSFWVNATNTEGYVVSTCEPVYHDIGVPQTPNSFSVAEIDGDVDGEGAVSLNLGTVATGVGAPPHSFRFEIFAEIPVIGDVTMFTREVDNYVSGRRQPFEVSGLRLGQLYMFSARAANQYGVSGKRPADNNITITGRSMASTSAVIGGVVGSMTVFLLLITIIIIVGIIVCVVVVQKRKKDSRNKSNDVEMSSNSAYGSLQPQITRPQTSEYEYMDTTPSETRPANTGMLSPGQGGKETMMPTDLPSYEEVTFN